MKLMKLACTVLLSLYTSCTLANPKDELVGVHLGSYEKDDYLNDKAVDYIKDKRKKFRNDKKAVYLNEKLEERIILLEKTVLDLQNTVQNLQETQEKTAYMIKEMYPPKVAANEKKPLWLCSVKALGQVYSDVDSSRARAKLKAVEKCKSSNDGFFCKKAFCEEG